MDFLVANGTAVLFYLFAVITVGSAIAVITMRNPMYSAISLLVCFLSMAALFLLRHAEFIAVVQVFVYGGGIMVLFLFVIMLVNLHKLKEMRLFGVQWPMAVILAILLIGLIVVVVMSVSFGPPNPYPEQLVDVDGEALGNSEAVGWHLYREYLLPFEIASIFLLVAMIGAVVLARKE
jgi:NADH-quinone oxidoreductase subunit J